MSGDLVIREKDVPFRLFLDNEGYLGPGYFRDLYDDLENKLNFHPGIETMIEELYASLKGTELPQLEDLMFELGEYDMEYMCEIASIEQAARCCVCERCSQCWLQGKDFTYNQFLSSDGLTETGDKNMSQCYADAEESVYYLYDYASSFNDTGDPMWKVVMQIVKRRGFALRITKGDIDTYLDEYVPIDKNYIFNDCQVILFPQMNNQVDITENGEVLLLTG